MGAVLRFDAVSCTRRGRKILDRLSLAIEGGELAVIEGGRGAGKTMLLAIAATTVKPDAGAVSIAGRDVLALQISSLPFVRRNIGYLPPEPPLLRHESALENVMLALAVRGATVAEAETRARAQLERVGIAAGNHAPVSSLSLGERRLVALARALIGGQMLVLLDEPAAGLAPADREIVAAAIAATAAAGAAVLCATADESFAALLAGKGGERMILADGRLAGGTPRIRLVDDAAAPKDEARPSAASSDSIEELDVSDLESNVDEAGSA